jgi:polyferredoxin
MKRIARRKTPYVKLQTWTLAAVQVIPLFLFPYIILPWLGHSGVFDGGLLGKVADQLFPLANYGHGREYWRSFGFILAWPLFFWNVFTSQPMWTWLIISFVQTFVIIPGIIYFWGKGAYCGWICSCGALAETLGDDHRTKMPHGAKWNNLNMAGQVILVMAFALLLFRILGWMHVDWAEKTYAYLFHDLPVFNYVWFVDLLLAGIIGVGLYFHFSGRVWCRFFCPLAALMHIYTRFSRFGIVANKKKCISCNVCTSVCHMGIDIMNFANKGLPMKDPECVRCSACVQSCPTGVLNFGQVDKGGRIIKIDAIQASPVQISE